MGKKTSWFVCLKKLFIPGSRPKREQKPKKWEWFFKRIKSSQCPAIEAPQEAVNGATDEQRKRAMAVAIATAAAAEAAVAAANAAAEVVRLTSIPYKRRNQHWTAAIKIQSAYRGHLAKQALSALKGLVKLQAVIRGELVRRNVDKTLPSLSRISKAKAQVHNKRIQTHFDYLAHGGRRHSLGRRMEGSKSEILARPQSSSIHRSWDLSSVSKEDIEASYQQKQEATAKRERMKQYSFSQREMRDEGGRLQESMMNHKENRRSIKSVEQHYFHEGVEKSKPWPRVGVEIHSPSQSKQRAACKEETTEESNSLLSQPRRSFCHVKQKSISEDGALFNQSVFPAYMAATKSTKAKSRSLSTPKQRLRLWDTTYSGELSPSKPMLSPWSSFSGEIAKTSRRNSNISQLTLSYYGTLI